MYLSKVRNTLIVYRQFLTFFQINTNHIIPLFWWTSLHGSQTNGDQTSKDSSGNDIIGGSEVQLMLIHSPDRKNGIKLDQVGST
jgi:hypothetical protein